MKCQPHQAEAMGICAYCGRALCAECAKPSSTSRLTCSTACATALTQEGQALQILLKKHLQGAQINAVFYLLCGLLSVGGAVGALYYLPSPFLVWFCVGCGVVFLAAGTWSALAARRNSR